MIRRIAGLGLLALMALAVAAAANQAYGPVRRGETLWQIAGRIYPGAGLSREQIMLGVLRANPGAFSTPCNVNGALRAGVVLRLPPAHALAVPDAATARRLLLEQNAAWAEHRRSGRRLVCPAPPPAAERALTEPQVGARPETVRTERQAPNAGMAAQTHASSDSAPEPAPTSAPPRPTPSSATERPPALPGPAPSAPSDKAAPSPGPTTRQPTLAPQEGTRLSLGRRGSPAPTWAIAMLALVLAAAAGARWHWRRRGLRGTGSAAAPPESTASLPAGTPPPTVPERTGSLVANSESVLVSLLRVVHARIRLVVALGAILVVLAIVPAQWSLSTRALLAWDCGAVLYLALAWSLMLPASAARTRRGAQIQRDGAPMVLFLTVAAAMTSLAAILLELSGLQVLTPAEQHLHIGLVVATLIVSWLLVHTAFALHYASVVYETDRPEGTQALEFPRGLPPVYVDFLYFAFVVGMTAQTSDVAVTTTAMRRLVTIHAMIGFFFNTALLALTINIAGSILD